MAVHREDGRDHRRVKVVQTIVHRRRPTARMKVGGAARQTARLAILAAAHRENPSSL